jgi:hypothetical protein
MESLTIKQLEVMCAAFESAFGEDADFMVWLEELTERQTHARANASVCGEGGLQ